jgi:hypothetical protein
VGSKNQCFVRDKRNSEKSRLKSSDEIEEITQKDWKNLAFDDMQNVFRNCLSCPE